MNKILIITGGLLESPFLKNLYETDVFDYVIAADHGYDAAISCGIPVDLLLGDFDSIEKLPMVMNSPNCEMIKFPPEKDYTDTHLAVLEALNRHPKEVLVVGATGTRLDHVLANIGLLTLGIDAGIKITLIDATNRISMMGPNQSMTIHKSEQYGRYVSLLPYTEKVNGIYLKGFKYPLSDGTLSIGISMGVSNEIVKEEGNIVIGEGFLIVIESKD